MSKCMCDTCKLEIEMQKLIDGKKPDDYIPVLAKLAGEALAMYQPKERDLMAQRFIGFMQHRAIEVSLGVKNLSPLLKKTLEDMERGKGPSLFEQLKRNTLRRKEETAKAFSDLPDNVKAAIDNVIDITGMKPAEAEKLKASTVKLCNSVMTETANQDVPEEMRDMVDSLVNDLKAKGFEVGDVKVIKL